MNEFTITFEKAMDPISGGSFALWLESTIRCEAEDDPESDHGPFKITIENTTTCKSSLNVAGEHFSCELDKPHDGLAHSNKKAQAIWL